MCAFISRPTTNNKSIIVFENQQFPAGVPSVSADLAKQKSRPNIIFDACLCAGEAATQSEVVGTTITVTGLNGKTQTLLPSRLRAKGCRRWAPKIC